MDDLDIIGLCLYYDKPLTTYECSLFFSIVDICKTCPSLPKKISRDNEDRIEIPMGIVIWKWIKWYYPYYYPYKFILIGKNNSDYEYDPDGVSQSSDTCHLFHKLQSEYGYSSNGLTNLSDDILNTGIPKERQKDFISLVNHLQTVIFTRVMDKFGKSFFKWEYPIFKIESENISRYNSIRKLDIDYLLFNMGTFSIPVSLYEEICSSSIEKIYDKTRVLENWMKFLVNANDILHEEMDFLLQLIPSIPGDDMFHCSTYFREMVFCLQERDDMCQPPANQELLALYEFHSKDFEEKPKEESETEKLGHKLYPLLNCLKFDPSLSRIITKLYVYGELSKTQFKINLKSDELDECLKTLLNYGTIIGHNKNKGKRYNITYYSLNKDLLDIVKEKVTDLSKKYDTMRQLVESVPFPLDNAKIYGIPNLEMPNSVSNKEEKSVHFNDYSVYLEDYPIYPTKKPIEPGEKEIFLVNSIPKKKFVPLDILIESLGKIGFSEEEIEIFEYLEWNGESTLLDIETDLYNHQYETIELSKNINKLISSGYIKTEFVRIKDNRRGNISVYSLNMPLDEIYLKEIESQYKKILDTEQEIIDIDNQMKLERSKV